MKATKFQFDKLFSDQSNLGTPIAHYSFVSELDNEVLSFIKDGGKKVKYVVDWTIVKIDVDESEQKYLNENNLFNYVVFANGVIDSRYTVQSHQLEARSSYLQDFHLNCIFETNNTYYVLCNAIHNKEKI